MRLALEALAALDDPEANPGTKATAKRVLTALVEKSDTGSSSGSKVRNSDIPKFSGKRNSTDIAVFFYTLAIVFMQNGITDVNEKINYCILGLGPAVAWWYRLGSSLYEARKAKPENADRDPFSILEETIKWEFLDPHQQEKARMKLQNMRQGTRNVSQLIEFFNEQIDLIVEKIPDGTKKFWLRNALNPDILRIMRPDCWETETFYRIAEIAIEAERNLFYSSGAYHSQGTYQPRVPPFQQLDQPTPMDLGCFYHGGRGRGGFGRGRGRGFGGRGFNGGRGRGRGYDNTFNRFQQQPQQQQQQRPGPPGGARNRFPCHECGSYDHFVRDCRIRQEKIRQQNNQRLRHMDFPPGFDPSKPSTSDFRGQQAPPKKSFADLFNEEEN